MCARVRVCTSTRVRVYVRMNTRALDAWARECMRVCTCVYARRCVCACMHVCPCACTCVGVHAGECIT